MQYLDIYGSFIDHQCRYDVLVENLFDPAHVPYAHKGLLPNFRDEEDPGRYVPNLTRISE
jgi:phenylpropionate dioxygenase-like ring-hydroxylating dioxygenase large terminal subunit